MPYPDDEIPRLELLVQQVRERDKARKLAQETTITGGEWFRFLHPGVPEEDDFDA